MRGVRGVSLAVAVAMLAVVIAGCSAGGGAAPAGPSSTHAAPAPRTFCRSTNPLERTIEGLYVSLLARCPRPSERVATRADVTRRGVAVAATTLAGSADGRARLALELYLIALARPPTASELRSATTILADSTKGVAFYAALLGSREAMGKAGSTATWLDNLSFRFSAKLLDAKGQADWRGRLAAGTTPTQVAQQMADTSAGRFFTAALLVGVPATGRINFRSPLEPAVQKLVDRGELGPARAALVASLGPQPQQRALLSGDSIAAQAAGYWRSILGPGVVGQSIAIPSFAACDERPLLLPAAALSRPDVVVISYLGNHKTACMKAAPRRSVVDRYRDDLLATFRDLRAAQPGVRIVLVTPLPVAKGADWAPDDLVALDHELAAAARDDVTVADGRKDLTTPTGAYTTMLPCLPDEPRATAPRCTGPVVRGVRQNVLRAPDGVHLCLGTSYGNLTCATWSPGAWRFARNLAAATRSQL